MELQELISLSLEETLTQIYDEMGITTGDITPVQAMLWNEITETATELFKALIRQNMEDSNE